MQNARNVNIQESLANAGETIINLLQTLGIVCKILLAIAFYCLAIAAAG